MESSYLDIVHKNQKISVSYFKRQGSAKILLYLHGLGCSKDDFYDAAQSDELRECTIIAFDFPGSGDTKYPSALTLNVDDLVEITHSLITRLKLENIVLVGHSVGGLLGLLYAEKFPEQILGFINIEGNLTLEDCFFTREVTGHSLQDFEEQIFPSIKQRVAQKQNLGFQKYAQTLNQLDPKSYYDYSPSVTEYSDKGNLIKRFLKLPISKLFVYGSENKALSYIPYLREHHCPVVEIPNSNHWPGYDNPTAFYAVINDFVQTI